MLLQNSSRSQSIVDIISSRLWIVLLCAALGGIIAIIVFLNMPLPYKASVDVIVEPGPYTKANERDVLAEAEGMASTYSQMMMQREVLQAAIDELMLETKPEALAGKVTAEPVRDKHQIQLSVVDSPSEEAANLAYAIAQAFVAYKEKLHSQDYAGLLVENQIKLDLLKGLTQQARDRINTLTANRAEELTRLSVLTEDAIRQKSDYQLLLQNQEDLQLKIRQLEDHVALAERAQPPAAASPFATSTVTATLHINPEPVIGGESYSDTVAGELLVSAYIQELTSRPIVEAALLKMGSQATYEDLVNNIIVKAVPGTIGINVLVTGRAPAEGALLANTIAAEFIEQNKASYQTQYGGQLADIENQMKKKSAEIGHTEAEIKYLDTNIKDSRSEITHLENLLKTYESDRIALGQNEQQIRLEMSRDLEVSLVVGPARPEGKSILSRILVTLLAVLAGAAVGIGLVLLIHRMINKTTTSEAVTTYEREQVTTYEHEQPTTERTH